MTELRIPADDFQVGDLVHTGNGQPVRVRRIVRDKAGRLLVNPGDHDELDGWVWEHATVTRNT
ncbi:hypothetical protein L0F81_17255 [Streptomyces tricolor]|uniref:Uncharacterized protein n=1 Tax=Streptomyces tricolor TaxID=68277 RepID=A0ABS9JHL1_9ACTN|nr:hypothetical protein [Streptomyces tricolor]MCG0065022.1 hypothetical protein [Streptomyces tricolor]